MDTRNRIAEGWVASDNRLDEDIIDLLFEFIHIVALFCNLPKDRCQGSFVADIHIYIGNVILVTD